MGGQCNLVVIHRYLNVIRIACFQLQMKSPNLLYFKGFKKQNDTRVSNCYLLNNYETAQISDISPIALLKIIIVNLLRTNVRNDCSVVNVSKLVGYLNKTFSRPVSVNIKKKKKSPPKKKKKKKKKKK